MLEVTSLIKVGFRVLAPASTTLTGTLDTRPAGLAEGSSRGLFDLVMVAAERRVLLRTTQV